jgi:diguanylate cyclase (GGDEF)-like protein
VAIPALLLGALLVLSGLGAMAFRWRHTMLVRQQAELMRIVRERTEQLEEVNRKLAQISYLDAVTEVPNRRSFDEELTTEWRRSTRTGSRLSLLMIDIDGFKSFNDTFGHQAGDECLRRVAGGIDETVRRAGDVVARYGGDEFAVLLPDTDTVGATALAERVRSAVAAREILHPAVQRPLTVSVGVATVSGRDDGEPARLVRAADAALYAAKNAGRNLVRIADPVGV